VVDQLLPHLVRRLVDFQPAFLVVASDLRVLLLGKHFDLLGGLLVLDEIVAGGVDEIRRYRKAGARVGAPGAGLDGTVGPVASTRGQ
jgi:hypothetical protein